jgi:hypothetical protein
LLGGNTRRNCKPTPRSCSRCGDQPTHPSRKHRPHFALLICAVRRSLPVHVSVSAQEERRLKKVQQELTAAREARVVPVGDAAALVEYMLDTAAEEMAFEISRCRPHLVRAWHSPYSRVLKRHL